MIYSVDLNADVGEGIGNEPLLMPYISSCNIACGGHAGDTETMRKVVGLAKQYGVKVGAHPSFPDKENFGRQPMEISHAALYAAVVSQIEDLMKILGEAQVGLHHIKPHGALYNLAATDEKIAAVIVEVMKRFALPIKLYVPYGSVIAKRAIKNNIPVVFEAFADRNYNDDLTLVPRSEKKALIHDTDIMFNHVFNMISDQKVITVTGHKVDILAQTFCVHGDNPEAIDLVKKLNERLKDNGIQIK